MQRTGGDDMKAYESSRGPAREWRDREDYRQLEGPGHHERDRSRSPQGTRPGEVIVVIQVGDLQTGAGEDGDEFRMKSFECVGSYNWIKKGKVPPTILVPGLLFARDRL